MRQVTNVAYDVDYRGYDPDEGVPGVLMAAIAVILLVALALWAVLGDAPREEAATESDPSALVIYTGNAAAMHEYGMPTKADCMEWHLHGQWGYWRDGTLYAFADLPGGSEAWDRLYGIEDNPNFDK